jgi:phage tail-like protein
MTDEFPLIAFNFELLLTVENAASLGLSSPLCQSEFAEVDGLEITMEPKTVKEGGNNSRQINLVGRLSYGSLTLKRGMTSNLDLWKWFALATAGPRRGTRAEGVLLIRDSTGKNNRVRITLNRCLPVKIKAPGLNAREGAVAIEEIQLAYESLTLVAP